jgi:hypothetical protein
MDVLKAVQTYVNKMISCTSGIKVLLLDSETVSLPRNCPCLCLKDITRRRLSCHWPAPPRTCYLKKSTLQIASTTQTGKKCLSSSASSSSDLQQTAWQPWKGNSSGHATVNTGSVCARFVGKPIKLMPELVFTSILKKSAIERLAETDENEVVQEIQVCQASVLVGLNSEAGVLCGLLSINNVSCLLERSTQPPVVRIAVNVRRGAAFCSCQTDMQADEIAYTRIFRHPLICHRCLAATNGMCKA